MSGSERAATRRRASRRVVPALIATVSGSGHVDREFLRPAAFFLSLIVFYKSPSATLVTVSRRVLRRSKGRGPIGGFFWRRGGKKEEGCRGDDTDGNGFGVFGVD